MNLEAVRERKGNFSGHKHNHPSRRQWIREVDSIMDKEKDFRVPHKWLTPIMEALGRQNRGEAEQHELTESEVDSFYQRPLQADYRGGEATEIVTFPQAKTPPSTASKSGEV